MVYLAVTILDLEHPSSQTPINSHLIIRVIPHRSRPMLAAAAKESWLKAHVTCHGNLWLLVKYQKAKYRFQLERCWNDKNYQYYHYSLSRDLVGRLCYVKYIKHHQAGWSSGNIANPSRLTVLDGGMGLKEHLCHEGFPRSSAPLWPTSAIVVSTSPQSLVIF